MKVYYQLLEEYMKAKSITESSSSSKEKND